MLRVVQQEVFARVLVEKGILSKEQFSEMVRVVNEGIKKKPKGIK
jgi:hypothetical protein